MIDQHDIKRIVDGIQLNQPVSDPYTHVIIWERSDGTLSDVPFKSYREAKHMSDRSRNRHHVLVEIPC